MWSPALVPNLTYALLDPKSPETDIARALHDLCAGGLFVEPTSATAAAAYSSLLASTAIAPSETTVVLLTGSGLKAAAAVADVVASAR